MREDELLEEDIVNEVAASSGGLGMGAILSPQGVTAYNVTAPTGITSFAQPIMGGRIQAAAREAELARLKQGAAAAEGSAFARMKDNMTPQMEGEIFGELSRQAYGKNLSIAQQTALRNRIEQQVLSKYASAAGDPYRAVASQASKPSAVTQFSVPMQRPSAQAQAPSPGITRHPSPVIPFKTPAATVSPVSAGQVAPISPGLMNIYRIAVSSGSKRSLEQALNSIQNERKIISMRRRQVSNKTAYDAQLRQLDSMDAQIREMMRKSGTRIPTHRPQPVAPKVYGPTGISSSVNTLYNIGMHSESAASIQTALDAVKNEQNLMFARKQQYDRNLNAVTPYDAPWKKLNSMASNLLGRLNRARDAEDEMVANILEGEGPIAYVQPPVKSYLLPSEERQLLLHPIAKAAISNANDAIRSRDPKELLEAARGLDLAAQSLVGKVSASEYGRNAKALGDAYRRVSGAKGMAPLIERGMEEERATLASKLPDLDSQREAAIAAREDAIQRQQAVGIRYEEALRRSKLYPRRPGEKVTVVMEADYRREIRDYTNQIRRIDQEKKKSIRRIRNISQDLKVRKAEPFRFEPVTFTLGLPATPAESPTGATYDERRKAWEDAEREHAERAATGATHAERQQAWLEAESDRNRRLYPGALERVGRERQAWEEAEKEHAARAEQEVFVREVASAIKKAPEENNLFGKLFRHVKSVAKKISPPPPKFSAQQKALALPFRPDSLGGKLMSRVVAGTREAFSFINQFLKTPGLFASDKISSSAGTPEELSASDSKKFYAAMAWADQLRLLLLAADTGILQEKIKPLMKRVQNTAAVLGIKMDFRPEDIGSSTVVQALFGEFPQNARFLLGIASNPQNTPAQRFDAVKTLLDAWHKAPEKLEEAARKMSADIIFLMGDSKVQAALDAQGDKPKSILDILVRTAKLFIEEQALQNLKKDFEVTKRNYEFYKKELAKGWGDTDALEDEAAPYIKRYHEQKKQIEDLERKAAPLTQYKRERGMVPVQESPQALSTAPYAGGSYREFEAPRLSTEQIAEPVSLGLRVSTEPYVSGSARHFEPPSLSTERARPEVVSKQQVKSAPGQQKVRDLMRRHNATKEQAELMIQYGFTTPPVIKKGPGFVPYCYEGT